MNRELPAGYELKISHYRRVAELFEHDFRERTDPIQAITHAQIIDEVTGEVVVEAYSHCSETDHFDKRIGRLIASGRALKELLDGPKAPRIT